MFYYFYNTLLFNSKIRMSNRMYLKCILYTHYCCSISNNYFSVLKSVHINWFICCNNFLLDNKKNLLNNYSFYKKCIFQFKDLLLNNFNLSFHMSLYFNWKLNFINNIFHTINDIHLDIIYIFYRRMKINGNFETP